MDNINITHVPLTNEYISTSMQYAPPPFSLLSYFSPLYFPIILLIYFSYFCGFSCPYITFLHCLDVKPLSLTLSVSITPDYQ